MFQFVTLPLFLLICVAALASAEWALVLVTLMFGVEQSLQTSSPTFLERSWLANVIVALVCGLTALRKVVSYPGTMQGYFTPVWMGILGLYAWSAISLVWTPSFASASEIITSNFPYFLLFILVAPCLLDNMTSVGRFARGVLYSGIFVVLTLVANPEFGTWSGRMGLVVGGKLITNPLAIGELGGTLLILAALLRTGPAPALLATARIAAFIMGAVLAIQSGSRGQLVFAVLIAIAFYPVSKRLKSVFAFLGTAVGVAVIAAGVLLLAQNLLVGFAAQRWEAGALEGGFQQRMANAGELLAEFVRSPMAWFLGLGANAFSSLNAVAAKDVYVHNMPTEILAELGIPMLVLFVALVVTTARAGYRLFQRYAEHPVERASLSVLLALGAYQFCLINKQGNLWANGMLFLYMLLITRIEIRTRDEYGGPELHELADHSAEDEDGQPLSAEEEPVAAGADQR